MVDFNKLRFDRTHHLGLGDVRLTIGQQQEIDAEIAALRARVEALEALLARWHLAFADVAGDTRDEDQREIEYALVADTEAFLPALLEQKP